MNNGLHYFLCLDSLLSNFSSGSILRILRWFIETGFNKLNILTNKHANRCRNYGSVYEHQLLSMFSSVAQSYPTVCDPMNWSTRGFPIQHQLLESTQTHVHWVGDAIQPSHPLSSPSPPALNLSRNQGLFKWVSSSYQVAKVLEFQL